MAVRHRTQKGPVTSYRQLWGRRLEDVALFAIVLDIPGSLILAFLVWIIGGKVAGLSLPGYWEMFRWIYIVIIALYGGYNAFVALCAHIYIAAICSLVEAPVADVVEAVTVHKLQDKLNPQHWKPGWFKEELTSAREKKAESERNAQLFMESLFSAFFGVGRR